jgi:AcrR family transcriptional regulator
MPTSASSHNRLKGPERREAILDAATRLLIEGGFESASTRRIAAEVGISQPSLYAHFPTKEALADALATRAFAALDRRMEQVATVPASLRLAAMIRGYIDFALEEPDAYRIAFMVEHVGPAPSLEQVCLKPGYAAFTIFAGALAELQAEGYLRAGDTATLAQTVWAGVHGLCALMLARPAFPWVERDALITAHVGLLSSGASSQRDG